MKDLIYIQDKALSSEFCRFTINKFEQDPHKQEGTAGDEVNHNIKKSTDLMINSCLDDPEWRYIYDLLRESLLGHFIEYLREHPYVFINGNFSSELSLIRSAQGQFDASLGGLYHMQLQKYNPDGGYFAWHHENHSGEGMNRRQVAFLWYLNDIAKGGETEFKFNNLKVSPQEGCLALFPAFWTHLHRGNPPGEGEEKYVIAGWLEATGDDTVSAEFPEDYFM